MDDWDSENLGFSFSVGKNDSVEISRHGKLVTRFGGKRGVKVAFQLQGASFDEQQQLMARLTGNYKRGNEKQTRN